MRLTNEEHDIMDGKSGSNTRDALQYQIDVGEFFGAEQFVRVRSAHLASDAESLREFGVGYLQQLADTGIKFRIPTTTNGQASDPARAAELGQNLIWAKRTEQIQASLETMGAYVCNTCVNYQTIDQPTLGENLAWGDTGTVIWANSICGARSNFEAGPAALMAGITGRVPAYGYHCNEQRLATVLVDCTASPSGRADWGALGAIVGRQLNDYWKVPCFVGSHLSPSPDDLKALGAALASFGSLGMFHWVGITPEAPTIEVAFGGKPPVATISVSEETIFNLINEYVPESSKADLVVFSAPQLSLFELKELSIMLDGSKCHSSTRLVSTTSPIVRNEAARLGIIRDLDRAGMLTLAGTCFYVMAPHELRATHGYHTLVTDSAKLANIIGGYGYNAVLRRTEDCIKAAITGTIDR
tara:strand:+ start:880 stop:2121 length:1242 start_codon:yes stop_codon:yes gene_type:complete